VIEHGNAARDTAGTRGWLVGHFIPDGIRSSGDVEIRWGVHAAGEQRATPVTVEHRTTVAMLVTGRFTVEFPDRTVTLAEPGDWVMWGPGVGHSWTSEEATTLVTVRWPSTPPDTDVAQTQAHAAVAVAQPHVAEQADPDPDPHAQDNPYAYADELAAHIDHSPDPSATRAAEIAMRNFPRAPAAADRVPQATIRRTSSSPRAKAAVRTLRRR
jgi:mannose-6-phosphate isomerase-like protein (cupin superfamily)